MDKLTGLTCISKKSDSIREDGSVHSDLCCKIGNGMELFASIQYPQLRKTVLSIIQRLLNVDSYVSSPR